MYFRVPANLANHIVMYFCVLKYTNNDTRYTLTKVSCIVYKALKSTYECSMLKHCTAVVSITMYQITMIPLSDSSPLHKSYVARPRVGDLSGLLSGHLSNKKLIELCIYFVNGIL